MSHESETRAVKSQIKSPNVSPLTLHVILCVKVNGDRVIADITRHFVCEDE